MFVLCILELLKTHWDTIEPHLGRLTRGFVRCNVLCIFRIRLSMSLAFNLRA